MGIKSWLFLKKMKEPWLLYKNTVLVHLLWITLRKLAMAVPASDHYKLRYNLNIKATLNLGECFERQVFLSLEHF